MNWKKDQHLRDLEDNVVIEATCLRCSYTWLQNRTQLLIKVDHVDVTMKEVEDNLPCPRPGCRHCGVRITLVKKKDTSGFVGGMP